MRKKLVLLLSLFLVVGLTACTSSKKDSGDTDADAAEMTGDSTGADANADQAKTDANGNSSADITDDFGTDDSSKKDAATTTADNATPPADNKDAASAQAGSDDLAGLDDSSAQPPPPPADNKDAQPLATNDAPPPTSDAAAVPPPADSAPPPAADETQGLADGMPAPPPAESKPVIPLQKMVTAPFTKKAILANALYVARSGDTLKSVSDKIYGQDKTADLKKVNPAVAHRKLKVGDKIYYNSPQRPTDNTQVLTYYEDKGLAPEVYLAQNGDDLKAVGKKLLGDKNSWKELWVTNPDVESKADLPEGTRLRYWSNETAPAPVVADNGAAGPEQNVAANPPPPTAAGQVGAPPPMPDQAPPPPPPPPVAQAAPPPPPPPVAAANPAPPPPPKKMAKAPGVDAKDAGGLMGDDPDQMMALGVGVILLVAAAALVIIIRKKRSKRAVDFQTASHTQIE